MSDGPVKVAEAASEQEAAVICGFLASNGVEATYDKGGVAQPLAVSAAYLASPSEGRQQILVRSHDAERATKLLAERSA